MGCVLQLVRNITQAMAGRDLTQVIFESSQ
jgi:hypothetical protein